MYVLVVLLVISTNFVFSESNENFYTDFEVISSKGEVWPKPKEIITDYATFVLGADFKFKIIGQQCDILDQALERYSFLINKNINIPQQENCLFISEDIKRINFLNINLKNVCHDFERINDTSDESYELDVGFNFNNKNIIEANSIWGILRGLETFSQLLYYEDTNNLNSCQMLNYTVIRDKPRFNYRSLMLDTSRHFISIKNILAILDGMVYNKFNVFHWHIIDDHAFPFKSEQFPELSDFGAYDPHYLIYTISEIKSIIEYARVRGIRVVPEIDTPGHTRSWGESHPEFLSKCIEDGEWTGQYGPFDPTVSSLYPFLEKFFGEIFNVFPDNYMHIGADEIDYACWKYHKHLDDFIKENALGNFTGLEYYYFQKLFERIARPERKLIAWEELFFSNGENLSKDLIYMTWIHGLKSAEKITKAGNKVIFSSSSWYLSQLLTGGDWEKLYKTDPHDIDGSEEQKALIIGGTVCMWSENVDDTNVLTRIWPRASAVAEKLWSPYNADDLYGAARRLEEHACRMIRRGLPTQPPNGPGYCLY